MGRRERGQVIGLDIGTHSIKLVQLSRNKKKWELINLGIMPLKPEAILNNTIINADSIISAIKNLVDMEKIEIKDTVLSVSGPSVLIKKIKLPFMTEEEIAETVSWEAEQYLPVDIEDIHLDFQVLEKGAFMSDEEGAEFEVLLVAVTREKVEDYTNMVLEAGLNPAIVDVDAFALENSCELNYDTEEAGLLALVDIGASLTKVHLLKDGRTVFAKDVPVGGNLYTKEIEKELGASFEDAEAMKMGEEREGFSKKSVSDIMARTTETIREEIQNALDLFRKENKEDVSKMLLSGGCSLIKGIDQYFSEKLNIPVELSNPFKKIYINEKIFDREYIEEMASLAAVGVGLALRRLDN